MTRFFVKVDNEGMCFVRKITTTAVFSKYRDNNDWKMRSFDEKITNADYCESLLKCGYVEVVTEHHPFSTEAMDVLTAELRKDALDIIADYRKVDKRVFLQNWCTAHRLEQLERGEITLEKACEIAEKRMERSVFRDLSEREQELEHIRNGNAPDKVSIIVEYGHGTTVRAYGTIENTAISRYERINGTASGWGYDKVSTAVADALNKSNDARKMLLEVKERALRDGATDASPTASCGRDNHTCIGYGAGYGVLPYFEGGVGMSSLTALFTRHGYTMERVDAPHATCYLFRKKEVNA